MKLPRTPDEPGGLFGTLVLLVLALGLAFPYFEQTRNANERPRLLQGIALVERGTFTIDGLVERGLAPGPDVSRTADGRLVPNKPPGASLVAAGAYAAARAVHGDALTLRVYTLWTRWLTGLLPTVLLAAWMLARMRRIYGRRIARAAVWLTVFATPIASYAHLAYGHMLAAALLVVGTELLVDASIPDRPSFARDHGEPTDGAGGRRRWIAAACGGALAAAAVVVEYAAAFAGVVLALLVLVRVRKLGLRSALAAVLGACIPLLGLLAYHDAMFGSPLSTGYHHVIDPTFADAHGQGYLGLGLPHWSGVVVHLFSSDAGLVWWVPLLVFALWGLAAAGSEPREPERTQGRVALAIFVVFVLVTVSLAFEGGWRVGPRYLVAALPLLAWGHAEVLSRVTTRGGWLALFSCLAVYGCVLNVLAANFWPHFDTAPIHHPLPEVLIPLWRDGLEPHGVARVLFGWEVVRVTTIATVVAAFVFIGRTLDASVGAVAGWIVGGLTGLALVAVTPSLPRHEASERNLAYIRRVWEPSGSTEAKSAALPRFEP